MEKRKGFTIVEVALFLAVTAALFIGIALGMQNAITQQRFNDATQNFYEFMKSVYSKVSNPQSPGYGNSSDYAIYGKLVVFGETQGMLGENFPEGEHPIFMYDVVGEVDDVKTVSTGSIGAALAKQNVNVVRKEGDNIVLATPEKYEMRWQMSLESKEHEDNLFKGSILVVRHPFFGTISTLFLNSTIEVNKIFNNDKSKPITGKGNLPGEISKLLTSYLDPDDDSASLKFEPVEINFCVSAYPLGKSGVIPRQNIRILKDARNASAVEMIELDKQTSDKERGNVCL